MEKVLSKQLLYELENALMWGFPFPSAQAVEYEEYLLQLGKLYDYLISDEELVNIHNSWTIDTTFTPEEWSSSNPARGQCGVTSCYISQKYKLPLFNALVYTKTKKGIVHYNNGKIDLTVQQFDTDGLKILQQNRMLSIDVILYNRWFKERYVNFLNNIHEQERTNKGRNRG